MFKARLLFLLLAGAIQTLINYWSRSPEVTQPLLQQADKNGILSAIVYLLLSFSKQANKLNYLVFHFVQCTNISCFSHSLFLHKASPLKSQFLFEIVITLVFTQKKTCHLKRMRLNELIQTWHGKSPYIWYNSPRLYLHMPIAIQSSPVQLKQQAVLLQKSIH